MDYPFEKIVWVLFFLGFNKASYLNNIADGS